MARSHGVQDNFLERIILASGDLFKRRLISPGSGKQTALLLQPCSWLICPAFVF
jgi:hypothetical protein